MEKLLLIVNIVFLLIITTQTYLLIRFKKARDIRKSENIVDVLTSIKREDDYVLDRERDDLALDEYLKDVKSIIDNYDKSRSKMIAFRTRRALLYKTIMIIQVISKYTTIDVEYDIDSKILPKRSDKDIMRLLVESYNNFSKDAPETFNDLLLCALLLSDNK